MKCFEYSFRDGMLYFLWNLHTHIRTQWMHTRYATASVSEWSPAGRAPLDHPRLVWRRRTRPNCKESALQWITFETGASCQWTIKTRRERCLQTDAPFCLLKDFSSCPSFACAAGGGASKAKKAVPPHSLSHVLRPATFPRAPRRTASLLLFHSFLCLHSLSFSYLAWLFVSAAALAPPPFVHSSSFCLASLRPLWFLSLLVLSSSSS